MIARVLGVALLLQAGGDFDDGVSAYRAGRFADAHAIFARLTAEAGEQVPVEVCWNDALAALRARDFRGAETAAERAALAGGPRYARLRDFLLGNVAFARSLLAKQQALGPEAEPFAFDVAIAYAQSAQKLWQSCAMVDDDAAAARRNVERAAREIEALLTAKRQAADKRKHDGKPEQKVVEAEAETPPDPKPEETRASTEGAGERATETIAQLLERLAAKEKEKLDLRRSRRATGNAGVERDW